MKYAHIYKNRTGGYQWMITETCEPKNPVAFGNVSDKRTAKAIIKGRELEFGLIKPWNF